MKVVELTRGLVQAWSENQADEEVLEIVCEQSDSIVLGDSLVCLKKDLKSALDEFVRTRSEKD